MSTLPIPIKWAWHPFVFLKVRDDYLKKLLARYFVDRSGNLAKFTIVVHLGTKMNLLHPRLKVKGQ